MSALADDAVRRLAAQVLAWRRSGTARKRFTGLPDGAGLDAAYAVQEALHALLVAAGSGPIVGYKIALTSAAMQQMVGVDTPLGGAIFESVVHRSPAVIARGDFLRLGLECEVAVRLGADLPAAGAPYRCDDIAAHVDACAPAFELVEDGGIDYATIDAPTLIVDNCWNGGIVLGEWTRGIAARWLDGAFASTPTILDLDDNEVGRGRVGDALGHPFEAVAWIANLLARRGRSLQAGMLVMTGSSVRTVFPEPGARAQLRIDNLGDCALRVD